MKIAKVIIPFFVASALSCGAVEDVTGKAEELGLFLCESSFTNTVMELATNRNIPNLISIDSNLTAELLKYGGDFWQDYHVEVFTGDSPEGDGSATHFIILKSKDIDILGIRLNYDKTLKKFSILSYWTFLDY